MGILGELQRELARKQRLAQQQQRRSEQQIARAAREAAREREKSLKAAARATAERQRELRRLYIEARKNEAAARTRAVNERVVQLDSVLASGIRTTPLLTFADLRKTPEVAPFDAAGLDRPHPEPLWESFAPPPPSGFGKVFGGARYERQLAAAQASYEAEQARHANMERDRLIQLAGRRRDYDRQVAAATRAAIEHNEKIDRFADDYRAGDAQAVAEFATLVLDSSIYPGEFPHRTRVLYRPEPREVVVEYELPPQSLVPTEREYRYVQSKDEITVAARPVKEIKERYARLIAQMALRTIHEIFVSDTAGLAAAVSFNGHVSTIDAATGQPIRPCLLSVSAKREVFGTFRLADLDPVACLRKLNALVSPHPYDLEPVRPVVDFETLLSQYRFVEGMDAVAALDSRRDLLDMTPAEFEHLVRQLFESMGMKAWKTQDVKDDGVDAVAVNEDPVFGGHCVIQAKRYRGAVGVDAVRELAGVMEDKHATTGILVTTSWVTKDGHAFKDRHGRIQIFECEQVKYLCQEHLGLDVLIGLPKPPPTRR